MRNNGNLDQNILNVEDSYSGADTKIYFSKETLLANENFANFTINTLPLI